ncbi:MAG: flagellin [Proteobacteria bacterium]|nr:flagellin [Pseudomonadota bacterium]
MTVINTNVKALYAQSALRGTERGLTDAMQQLSTGKRINSGKDDAAGMAIAARMTQQIRSLNQAVRNAGDAIALIQTAEGATGEITDMMQRMRELAIQAINDTNSNEQRSYLDLEFQQLKQEIVRVSDTTEWNGFSVLDGSAGYRVGERPVYKTTSVADYDSVFVNPTTTRSITGDNAGETQVITFTSNVVAASGSGTYTVTPGGGSAVSITVSNGATPAEVASALAAALNAVEDRAYTAEASAGAVYLYYQQSSDNVATASVASSGVATQTNAVTVPFGAINDPTETFDGNGKFLKSGDMTVTITGDSFASATFTTSDGEELTMIGTYTAAAGTLTFDPDGSGAHNNSAVISDVLTYYFTADDGTGGADTSDLTDLLSGSETRDFTFGVSVQGSIPQLNTGDLIINGVTINATEVGDDTLSPANNSLGSSIAKAAAINRHSAETNVYAVVNENIFSGGAQTGTSIVSGRVVINGITSPTITTVMGNKSQSREAVVEAINLIKDQTGVRAVDSGTVDEGIRLVAADGRNIEVTFDTAYPVADFAARTGLREGVQAGTFSLETSVEGSMVISTDEDGSIINSGLRLGDFTTNISSVSNDVRAAVASGGTPVALSGGDLVINGVAIRGAASADDTLTQAEALTTTTNTRASSGVAMAAAINASSAETGVTAVATSAKTEGDTTTIDGTRLSGEESIYLNGVEVVVNFTVSGTTDTETRLDRVVEAVAASFGEHGVVATKNEMGGLTFETPDGRNLSVWIPQAAGPATVSAAEFGLTYDGSDAPGVTNQASVTLANATTLYGGVSLLSDDAITIEPGASGYTSSGNFRALGFTEGTYGGEVDDSTSKMTPPRTGRLTFHVGPSAGQVITIDLADFGKGGPITSEITGDVDLGDSDSRLNRIDNVASAQAMLEKLDSAVDKVNATRARMGSVMNRLEHTIDNLMNVSVNTEFSRSQIQDADYAQASTDLARSQIMQQASIAVLAQANTSQQSVLQLLQG